MSEERQAEQLMEKFTKGLTQVAGQIASAIMFFIMASAATATDPFWRRKFGERYFTPLRAILSFIGWTFALGLTIYPYVRPDEKFPLANVPLRLTIISNLISWGYLILVLVHFRTIRRRQVSGELWHSRSRGESIWGSENTARDMLLDVFVVIGLAVVFPYAAGFYALSRILGYMADAAAMRALYNRYLDIRDAQIEAEFMETTLREGFPPHRTAGIYRPLPKRFTGQNRGNIARVLASGAVANRPAATAQPVSSTATVRAGSEVSQPNLVWKIVSPLVRSKKFWLVVIVGVAVAGLIHFLPSHWHKKSEAKPVAIEAPPPVVNTSPEIPATTLAKSPAVQTPPPNPAPAPTVELPKTAMVQAAPVAIAAPPITREQWLDKISTALDDNANAVVQFERTAKGGFAKLRTLRSALSDNDDAKFLPTFNGVVQKYNQLADEQVAFVNNGQTYRVSLAADTNANLEEKFGSLTNTLNGLKEARQTLLASVQSACDQLAGVK
jgi:hypothetical protein